MAIFSNLRLKIAALCIAAVLWGAVQGIRSVEQSLDVPIAFEGIPADVVLVDQSAREVNLRIAGSRSAVRRAERQLTRYPISALGVKEGEARFAIEVDRLELPRGARVAARSPSSVTIHLEPRARKRVRVRPDLVGEVPVGHRLVSVEVRPEEVVLEGAQGELRRVREVLTERIELGTLVGPTEQEVRLAPASEHVWRADDGGPIRVHLELRPDGDSGRDAGSAIDPGIEDSPG